MKAFPDDVMPDDGNFLINSCFCFLEEFCILESCYIKQLDSPLVIHNANSACFFFLESCYIKQLDSPLVIHNANSACFFFFFSC